MKTTGSLLSVLPDCDGSLIKSLKVYQPRKQPQRLNVSAEVRPHGSKQHPLYVTTITGSTLHFLLAHNGFSYHVLAHSSSFRLYSGWSALSTCTRSASRNQSSIQTRPRRRRRGPKDLLGHAFHRRLSPRPGEGRRTKAHAQRGV